MLTDRDYDLISGYLDDALTDSERAEVESRLLRDTEFAAELTAIRHTITLVKTLPELVAPRDFRLTPEQVSAFTPMQAKSTWTPNFAPRLTRTFLPLMSAAASLILVVVGFLSMFGGGLTPQSLPNMGSVAMLASESAMMDDALVTPPNPAPVSPQAMTTETFPSGFDGADFPMDGTDSRFGSGGGSESGDIFPQLGETDENADGAMMMSVVQPTPSAEVEMAGAARSSNMPPTSTLVISPTATDAESTFSMFESAPTDEDSEAGDTSFDTYAYQATEPAADTMMLRAPSDVITAVTEESAGYDDATAPVIADILTDTATPKRVDDSPERDITPLGGLLLMIGGLGLGLVTALSRFRKSA